jgi:hypothetical protein
MIIKINSEAVAELFFAARRLLYNTPYTTALAPSLDQLRNALAAFALAPPVKALALRKKAAKKAAKKAPRKKSKSCA